MRMIMPRMDEEDVMNKDVMRRRARERGEG